MSTPIQQACFLVGGQSSLAKRLSEITGKDVTQQRVRNWISRESLVPPEFVPAVEVATGGRVTRKDLRPDDHKSIWPEWIDPNACETANS